MCRVLQDDDEEDEFNWWDSAPQVEEERIKVKCAKSVQFAPLEYTGKFQNLSRSKKRGPLHFIGPAQSPLRDPYVLRTAAVPVAFSALLTATLFGI